MLGERKLAKALAEALPLPLVDLGRAGTRPELVRLLPRVVAERLGVLVLAGGAAWRFWPRPVEPLSVADVQNTYAGMVRADGTNDASVMTRRTVTENPVSVKPEACAPLVEATVANRFPAAAQDGAVHDPFTAGSAQQAGDDQPPSPAADWLGRLCASAAFLHRARASGTPLPPGIAPLRDRLRQARG